MRGGAEWGGGAGRGRGGAAVVATLAESNENCFV